MKMNLIYMKMKVHAELIFVWKVSNVDSFWNRGTGELENGLLIVWVTWYYHRERKLSLWTTQATLYGIEL